MQICVLNSDQSASENSIVLRVMTLLFNTRRGSRVRNIFTSLREFMFLSVLHKSTFHLAEPVMRALIEG